MPFGPPGKPEFDGPYNPADEERAHIARLGDALTHLHSFAATFNPGDIVDEESKLTGDDLHVILDLAEKMHRMALDAPPQR